MPLEQRPQFILDGLVDTEKIISHRFPLTEIDQAIEVMGGKERNKVIVNP